MALSSSSGLYCCCAQLSSLVSAWSPLCQGQVLFAEIAPDTALCRGPTAAEAVGAFGPRNGVERSQTAQEFRDEQTCLHRLAKANRHGVQRTAQGPGLQLP
jgi:hypothetical protein